MAIGQAPVASKERDEVGTYTKFDPGGVTEQDIRCSNLKVSMFY